MGCLAPKAVPDTRHSALGTTPSSLITRHSFFVTRHFVPGDAIRQVGGEAVFADELAEVGFDRLGGDGVEPGIDLGVDLGDDLRVGGGSIADGVEDLHLALEAMGDVALDPLA